MMRLLLSGLMSLALLPVVGLAADAFYINNGTVNRPQVDAINFVNRGLFQALGGLDVYETSNTLNYSNKVGTFSGSGTIIGSPGFRFDTFSTATGLRTMASSFFNDNGAVVQANDPFASFLNAPCSVAPVDPSYLLISATNIVVKAPSSSPLASLIVGPNGEMRLEGKHIDLSRSGLEVLPVWDELFGSFLIPTNLFQPDIAIYDQYWGRTNLSNDYAVDSGGLWDGFVAVAPSAPAAPFGAPGFVLFGPVADSYINAVPGSFLRITVTNFTGSSTNVTGTNFTTFSLATNITKGAVFVGVNGSVQTGFSPSPFVNNHFDTIGVLFSVDIPNAVTAQLEPAYVFFEDRLGSGGTTGLLANVIGCPPVGFRPANYDLERIPFYPGDPGNNGYPDGNFFVGSGVGVGNSTISSDLVTDIVITNGEFSVYSAFLDNVVSRPPPVAGGTVTNLPGRIRINADTLDLSKTRMRGEGQIVIQTSHLISSTNAVIDCENLSFNLASTNGNLKIQSLSPDIVARLRGNIYTWSAVWSNTAIVIINDNYEFTNNETVGTNVLATIIVTNTAGTTDGQTITVNGDLRTWTTNVTNPTNQIFTGESIGEAATNLFDHVSSFPFAALSLAKVGTNGISLRTAPNGNINVQLSPGWGRVSYTTNDGFTNVVAIQVPLTNTIGIGLQTLMIDATALTTTLPVIVYDLTTHSTNVVIDDNMTLVESAFIDGLSLTLNGDITIPGIVPVVNPILGIPPPGDPFQDWNSANAPNLLYFTNNAYFFILDEAHFGDDRPTPYSSFVNTGTVDGWSLDVNSTYVQNSGSLLSFASMTIRSRSAKMENGSSSSNGDTRLLGDIFKFNNYQLNANGGLYLNVSKSLFDAGTSSGNTLTVQNGFNLEVRPLSGDLLGTTLQTAAPGVPSVQVDHTWAAMDLGSNAAGYSNNTAIGRLVVSSQSSDPLFVFKGTGAHNALYVDLLDISALSDYTNQIIIDPSLVIYFAAASVNFTPPTVEGTAQEPEEYLAGQFGGHLLWVRDFAGPNSSIDVVINGKTAKVNRALRNSRIIDSDGDGLPNFFDFNPFDEPSATLVVQINGTGTVSPDYNGQSLVLGDIYTVTAQPGNGFAFSNWTGAVNSTAAQLTFTMQSNLVLIANFVPGAFVPTVASYSGLFSELSGVRRMSSGAFTATTTSSGSYSGRLQIGANRYAFNGQLDSLGATTNSVMRKGDTPLTVIFQADLADNERITGTVSDGTWVANLEAERAVFNVSDNRAPFAGRYTLIFPGSGDPGNTGRPFGDGFGAVTVDPSGQVRLKGMLADGEKLTQTASLSRRGRWPLYVPIYRGQGHLLGWLVFTNTVDDDISGEVSWIKPAIPAARFYPAGFDVEVLATGSLYNSSATPVLSFNSGALVLTGGNLATGTENDVMLTPDNKVTSLSGSPLTFKLNTSQGLFKGSVVDPITGAPVVFNGAVLQKRNLGFGFFLGTDQSGRVDFGP